jgi:hypothetical protein
MRAGELSNAMGDRGEAIFVSLMTKFHGKFPLFRRPLHLEEKWPLVDYVCELNGPWKALRPFFFVQVKATTSGYTKADGRLKVAISWSEPVDSLGTRFRFTLLGLTPSRSAFTLWEQPDE